MKTRNLLYAGRVFLKTRFLGQRIPLALAFELTHRCNLKCPHCYTQDHVTELGQQDHLEIIKVAAQNGCRFLSLTGGEPLVVEHFPALVQSAHAHGLWVQYTTNGVLLAERAEEISLDPPDLIQISLDGDRTTHEKLKGQGVFPKVMKALEIVQRKQWRCLLLSLLSKFSTSESLFFVIEQALKTGAFISFQPVCDTPALTPDKKQLNHLITLLLGIKNCKNWKELMCFWEQNTKLVFDRRLMQKKFCQPLNQSGLALNYLKRYPDNANLDCIAGKIMGRIRPDSQLVPCYYAVDHQKPLYILEHGFAHAWNHLNKPACTQCWHHHRLELTLIYNLSLQTMKDVFYYHFMK